MIGRKRMILAVSYVNIWHENKDVAANTPLMLQHTIKSIGYN